MFKQLNVCNSWHFLFFNAQPVCSSVNVFLFVLTLLIILLNFFPFTDDSLVLAASNMIDRYWNGTIWYYEGLDKFDRNQYTAAIRTESGVCAAAYLGKYDKFVIGEHSGLIQIFEVGTKPETQSKELQCMGYSCQHDDSLTSISTFHDYTHIVTAGMDTWYDFFLYFLIDWKHLLNRPFNLHFSIKVWDTSEMLATSSFNNAQTDVVTCVEAQTGSDAVFVSTSMDSEALLWDTRKTNSALG